MRANPSGINLPTSSTELLRTPRGAEFEEGTKAQKLYPSKSHLALKSEAHALQTQPGTQTVLKSDVPSQSVVKSELMNISVVVRPQQVRPSDPPEDGLDSQNTKTMSVTSTAPSAGDKQQADDLGKVFRVLHVVGFAILMSVILICGSLAYLKPLQLQVNEHYSLYLCLSLILAALYAVYFIEGISIVVMIFRFKRRFDPQTRLKVVKLKVYSAGVIFNASLIFTALVFVFEPLPISEEDFTTLFSYTFALPITSLVISLVDLLLTWYFVYPPCGKQELNKEDRYTIIIALVITILLPVFAVMFIWRSIKSCGANPKNTGQPYAEASGKQENNRLQSEA